MPKPIIWSRAVRDLLFEELVERFGPYKDWEMQAAPSRRKRAEFDKFCASFADLVGAKSGEAVKHQIAWAIGVPMNSEHHWDSSQARNAMLNMAAAFDAGFIRNRDFPELTARHPKSRYTIDDLLF
jgi:hypothetical protein